MTASPRSPSPSPAPSGTVRASSAFGIKKIDRRWRLCHEDSFRQIGPLRDLYKGLHRAGARSGIQLIGCPVRCCLGLYQESGPCGLDPDPVPVPMTVGTPGGSTDRPDPGLRRRPASTLTGRPDLSFKPV